MMNLKKNIAILRYLVNQLVKLFSYGHRNHSPPIAGRSGALRSRRKDAGFPIRSGMTMFHAPAGFPSCRFFASGEAYGSYEVPDPERD